MNTTKKLTYAYKTSPHADKFNGGKGCWLVFGRFPKPKVFQDSEKWSALEYFEKINLPINMIESHHRDSTPFKYK